MIVILTLYGFTLWMSAIAYALITDQWPVLHVILAGPVIISTAVLVLAIADYAIWKAIMSYRARKRVS